MTSQLARELTDNLLEKQEEEENPSEFISLDEASDHSEDLSACPIMGHALYEAGTFKHKKTCTGAYQEETHYIQWIAVDWQSHHPEVMCGHKETSALHRVSTQQRRDAYRPHGWRRRSSRKLVEPANHTKCRVLPRQR